MSEKEKLSRPARSRSRERVSKGDRKSGPEHGRASRASPDGATYRGRVPDIISKLYSASALYPGKDGDGFEHLLNELAAALAPTDVIEWLLVADLRAMIFDERRYR